MTFGEYQRVLSKPNHFLYNDGAERQPELGIDFTFFRSYDPALGRWWQTDMIHKFHESPYAWVTNNPISFNDPWGLDTLDNDGGGGDFPSLTGNPEISGTPGLFPEPPVPDSKKPSGGGTAPNLPSSIDPINTPSSNQNGNGANLANPALPIGLALEDLLVALGITIASDAHRNSNSNGDPNHVYMIFSTPKGVTPSNLDDILGGTFRVEKYGVTSSSIPISPYVYGSLQRPESQVSRLNASDPLRIYNYVWMQTNLKGRMAAKSWEAYYVSEYFIATGRMPNRQILPKPSYWEYLKTLVK